MKVVPLARHHAIICLMTETNPIEQQPEPPPKLRPTQLSKRLVSEECMRQSLKYVLANLKRYTLLIDGTGNDLRPQIILTEEEPWPILGDTIDARLLTARRVTILATTKDRGTALIDLTARCAYRWVRSKEIRDVVESFDNHLKSGARWRFIQRRSGSDVYFILLCLFVIGIVIIGLVNSAIAFAFWATCIAYLIVESVIIRLSGPLLIWPMQLPESVRPKLWQVPRLRISRTSWQLIWTSLLTCVVGGIIVGLVVHFTFP
jgi:hypothetical protein